MTQDDIDIHDPDNIKALKFALDSLLYENKKKIVGSATRFITSGIAGLLLTIYLVLKIQGRIDWSWLVVATLGVGTWIVLRGISYLCCIGVTKFIKPPLPSKYIHTDKDTL
jgi:hypothetical protein